jgi:lactate dehydrogenase-like 2-hydroxyacid dehydrogenase
VIVLSEEGIKQGFDLKQMLYYDRNSIGEEREKELGATRETDLDTMLAKCDVVVVNTPLTDQTRYVTICVNPSHYLSQDDHVKRNSLQA